MIESIPITSININIFDTNTGKYLTSQKFAYKNKQSPNTPLTLLISEDLPNQKVKTKNYFSPLEETDIVLEKKHLQLLLFV